MDRLTYKNSVENTNELYCEYENCDVLEDSCPLYQDDCIVVRNAINKLAHYEDLIEQGLIPSYHIGDSIYFRVKGMNQFGEHVDFIQTQKISKIDINEDGILYSTATERFMNKDVGIKVFLTREQAEKRLKEMER